MVAGFAAFTSTVSTKLTLTGTYAYEIDFLKIFMEKNLKTFLGKPLKEFLKG